MECWLQDFIVKRATYHSARPSLDHILTMILSNPEPLVSHFYYFIPSNPIIYCKLRISKVFTNLLNNFKEIDLMSKKMSRPNLIASSRSLFNSVHRTTYQDSHFGPYSYTFTYYITWWNILNLTLTTNISLSRTQNKFFCICCHIDASFNMFQGRQLKCCGAGICWYSNILSTLINKVGSSSLVLLGKIFEIFCWFKLIHFGLDDVQFFN